MPDAQLSARKSVIAAHHGAAFKDFGIEYHPLTTQLNFGFHKKSHVDYSHFDYSKVRNSARAPDCESSQTNPGLALRDDIVDTWWPATTMAINVNQLLDGYYLLRTVILGVVYSNHFASRGTA
jgi:hypothetical protein